MIKTINHNQAYYIKQLKSEIATLKSYKLPTFQLEVKLYTILLTPIKN